MSQNPHPHDPFSTEPGAPAPAPEPQPEQPERPDVAADARPEAEAFAQTEQAEAPASDLLDVDGPSAPTAQEQGSPTSDPAVHPYDPYATPSASEARQEPAQQPVDADPYATGPVGPQDTGQAQYAPYAGQPPVQQPYAQQQAPHPQHAAPHSAAHGHPSAGGTMNFDQAPAHVKGVFDGPLPGQPTTDSDAKLWAMFSHLSAIIGYVIGAGFLGWLGPLIIFLVYKDRNRYVRYNAAESLNAAIATLIAEIALGVVITIIAILTFGIGSVLYVLVGVPALLHIIFAIIGAVKANQGEWWNYPLNIRIVK